MAEWTDGYETIQIETYGKGSVRVRCVSGEDSERAVIPRDEAIRLLREALAELGEPVAQVKPGWVSSSVALANDGCNGERAIVLVHSDGGAFVMMGNAPLIRLPDPPESP